MAAAEVDLGYLSAHLGVSEPTLSTFATSPTVDLVNELLQAVAAKAQDFDNIIADKLRVDIELENAVRSSESRVQSAKATTEKALKDVEELRQKLQEQETSRLALENELQALKSSSSTSQSNVDALQRRIESLESSNRDTLAALETKNKANSDLSDELQKQHQKNLDLRKQLGTLQQQVQTADSVTSAARYRETNLKEEVAMVRRHNEWCEKELKTKGDEALKTRREKGAVIAQLTRERDDAVSTAESLKRSEEHLRTRLQDAQNKLNDALTRIQQLQEDVAQQEENARQERDASARLVQLKEQQTETHRNRLREVESRLEKVQDDLQVEIRALKQELEHERQDHERAVEDAQRLHEEIGKLEAQLFARAQPGSVPQTPQPNGTFRPGSPYRTPRSTAKTVSIVQVMDELYEVKGKLGSEVKKRENLQNELDEFLEAAEAKRFELEESEAEKEHLKAEIDKMTRMADESYQERDVAKKTARKAEAAAATAQAELNILRAQVRDLSTQIQLLIFNINAQEKGFDQLTEEELSLFERLQQGEPTENALDDMSDTHQFITQKFVAFKDVAELQEKNQELLKLTRQLADQMENDEALAAKQQAAQNEQEVQRLRTTVAELQDEAQSINIRMRSYMAERDMFRRLLQQKASAAEIASALGGSIEGSQQREVLASIEQDSAVGDGDVTRALQELQSNFDAYRNEQGVDRKTLREQLEKLSTERGALQGEISRLRSQEALANGRFEMLQGNLQGLQKEKEEVQRRNSELSETSAKLDLRIQQITEDMVDAQGLVESMRNETSNLRAEKDLWKSIQDRLVKDNEDLTREKETLKSTLATQESLQNERELTESETKRRLQNEINSLETELNATRRKLSEEVDESKKLQLRKEFDSQQAQKRIDDLLANLSQTREELASAKTSRDHLQARNDELTVELRNAKENMERLRPQPTPRPGSMAVAEERNGDDADTRIRELTDEIADLRNELDLTKTSLENAKAQVERYREISQAAEEELENLNSTQDQYHEEMDASLAAKDNAIKDLEQRVSDISTELADSNSQLSSVRDSQAEVSRRHDEEKRVLESEIQRLKDNEERHKETAKFHQSDLRAQADIATKAQQDYEAELVKHAAAATSLQSMRAEFNKLKTETARWKAEAESAKIALMQSESSWEDRRSQFEQELAEVSQRREDANEQVKLLTTQLDTFNKQFATLQQNRSSSGDSNNNDAVAAVTDSATAGLLELNNYLRREKEIIEVQYEIKMQEMKRMQVQYNHSQSQLDDARLKLEQERRSQTDSTRSSLAHKDIMEKLNELSLLRESNSALRAESSKTQEQLGEKTKKVEELEGRIQPLEAQIAELETQKGFVEKELEQAQNDRNHWQKRHESVLTKYGRADPEELEQLKQTVADLTAERDALKQSEEPLNARIQELESEMENERARWTETRQKIVSQAKERSRDQSQKIFEANKQKEEISTQKDELAQQLASVQSQLEAKQQELEAALGEKSVLEEQLGSAQQQVESVPAPAATTTSTDEASAPTNEQTTQLQQQLADIEQQLQAANEQKSAVEEELRNVRSQLESVISERDQALANVQAQSSQGAAPLQNGATEPDSQTPASAIPDVDRQALEEKIATAEAKAAEYEQKAADLETRIDAIVKERSEKMKGLLNKKLKEDREKAEGEVRESRTRMEEEFKLKLEQEIAIWKAENPSPGGAQAAAVLATPSKQLDSQPPATPTAGTPAFALSELNKLSDEEVRGMLTNNATLKSIMMSNIKKFSTQETNKLRAEYEQKITSAKEMEAKKSNLRINMLDNKVKLANSKLGVVETAAQNTPQRAVVEVWNMAKDTKLPAPVQQSTPLKTSSSVPALPLSSTPTANAAAAAPAAPAAARPTSTNPVNSGTPQAAKTEGVTEEKAGTATPSAATPTAATNPFAMIPPSQTQPPSTPAAAPAQNPFAPQPLQGAQQTTQPAPAATQTQQQPPLLRSGIPMPSSRGGGNARGGRGGVYQAPGQRGRGGRGGQGGGRGGLNASASEFNPGNKRARGDSEIGAGANKRQRGGGGGGGAAS